MGTPSHKDECRCDRNESQPPYPLSDPPCRFNPFYIGEFWLRLTRSSSDDTRKNRAENV